MKTRFIVPLLLLVYQVEGDYRLLVRSYSYSNPSNKCAGCPENSSGARSCCDDFDDFTGRCGGDDRCDNYFWYCLRPIGSSLNAVCNVSQSSVSTAVNGADIDFSGNTVLGLPNPLPLNGISPGWNGVQFAVAAFDEDARNDELVDTISIDFSSTDLPVRVEKTHMKNNGVSGFSQFELSFLVVCAENYYGPDCSQFCEENCTCDPGFTGEFCHININDCVTVNCSENGQCVDGINSYECVCDPGFTGDQCEENIDDCMEDSCNGNGQCVDAGVNFFTCDCHPGFTGDQCEENIDDCVEYNCSGNGQCTDGVETFTCNCNLGFTGRMCEENIDDCVGVNCSGNGQCRDGVNSYICECDPGFTGDICDQNITWIGEPSGLDPTLVAVTAGVVGGLVLLLLLACLATIIVLAMKLQKINHKLEGHVGTAGMELKANEVYGVNLSPQQRSNVQSKLSHNDVGVDVKLETNQAY